MKILVVDFAASEGGALTALGEFYEEAKNDKNNEYVFLLSGNYVKSTNNVKVIVDGSQKKHFKRLKFDLWSGKKYIKQFNPDLIFSLQNTIIFGAKRRQVVYVHQAIPFQNEKRFSIFKKQELKYAIIQYPLGFLIKKSIKVADAVIVQTKWMKKEICQKTGKDDKKVFVIKPTVNMAKKVVAKNVDGKNFFCLTSDYPYKNNKLLLRAIGSMVERGVTDFVVDFTLSGDNSENVKYIGKISRETVFKKMSKSVLVFPSYIESFGLPLLEAKEVGTIVLASDTDFSHEILDGYGNAYFFDPFSVESLMCLMERCVKGEIKLKHKQTVKPGEEDLNIVGVLEEIVK